MYTQINNGHRLNGREHETEWQPASAGNKSSPIHPNQIKGGNLEKSIKLLWTLFVGFTGKQPQVSINQIGV